MKLGQIGNSIHHNIEKIQSNPKEGFSKHDKAESIMRKLYEAGDPELTSTSYQFTIMELFWAQK